MAELEYARRLERRPARVRGSNPLGGKKRGHGSVAECVLAKDKTRVRFSLAAMQGKIFYKRASGETGIRARLKIVFRKECGFDAHLGHKLNTEKARNDSSCHSGLLYVNFLWG